MSVNILYTRLFNLSIFHDYYTDGLARGIHLTPTLETVKLLSGGRMLLKEIPKGITVLYRTQEDETTPLVNAGPDARLIFSLNADQFPELQNITNFDESIARRYKAGNLLYYKNNPTSPSSNPATPEDFTLELIDLLQGSLFTYEFTVTPPLVPSEDVTLTVTDENLDPVSVGKTTEGLPFDDTLTISVGENGVFSQQIDLRNKPKGKYTITIRKSSDDSFINDVTFYSDEMLLGKKIAGIVDIEFNTATNLMYQNTWEYAIRLTRKTSVWKYFIVDKNKTVDFDANDLYIHDDGSDPGLPYASSYTFTRDGDEPHPSIKINGLDTVIFKSDGLVPIPFFEVPKLKLQLRKTPGAPGDPAEVTLITNLPNPKHNGVIKEDAGVPESEIYVFI